MLNSVLVVEDVKSVQQVLVEQLTQLGVRQVTAVSDGLQALDAVQQSPNSFQAIITDLLMPNMDGLQLLEQLGDAGYQGGVIIASGLERRIIELSVEIARSHQVRLVGSLSKPVTSEQLHILMQRVLRLSDTKFEEKQPLSQEQVLTAIEQGHLLPYYQPKIDALSRQITGYEVLCRVDLPGEKHILLPDLFISTAAKFKLLDQLTEQLLEQSLSEVYKHQKEFVNGFPSLAFNLSPVQLFEESMVERIIELAVRFRLLPKFLTLEVTEQQALHKPEQLSLLNRLRIHGFGVALDDFGTGFTNLKQLRELPFTEIKLDKCLSQGIHQDQLSQVVLDSLFAFADKLDMKIVVEGIDDIADFEFLQGKALTSLQGFLISRPKPLSEIIRWQRAWQESLNKDHQSDVIQFSKNSPKSHRKG